MLRVKSSAQEGDPVSLPVAKLTHELSLSHQGGGHHRTFAERGTTLALCLPQGQPV